MRFGNEINSFMSYFQEFLDRLADVPDGPPFAVLKKLGFVAAIDGLSKVGTSGESKNRLRFVSFLQRFSDWSDGERISLPHLVEALSRDREPEFQPLKKHVDSLFQSQTWSPGSAIFTGPHNIARDPMPDQLLDRWPKGKKILGKYSEESFSHVNLLYRYRNFLAHELREPGLPRLESDVTYAHYHYTFLYTPDNQEGRKTWLLHHPVRFFSTITSTCLGNLGEWLRENEINPYVYYKVGSELMLEELE